MGSFPCVAQQGPDGAAPSDLQTPLEMQRPVEPEPDIAAPAEIDHLLAELARPDQPGWEQIEQSILREWSHSGSASMDLLLLRGRKAMAEGDLDAAIEHFTALTDHAPDFAEGWNARATAYFYAGYYGLSISDIQHALMLNPRHFGALSGLGFMLDTLGYESEALEALRAVEAIHPHRPEVIDAIERLEKTVEGERL
ncbi:tetratricopeptide repeat protein [Tropicimonas sp. IMCC34043]|uniref:tetratricopeptide repeat protein n=1 Tax=Tropicimonas sp. IMCC34043 TaxID=2248760 RepID=UPI001E64CB6B|nr:tetratricopeptide repeat protein [Tropicimonas sp. IMCC34043]